MKDVASEHHALNYLEKPFLSLMWLYFFGLTHISVYLVSFSFNYIQFNLKILISMSMLNYKKMKYLERF